MRGGAPQKFELVVAARKSRLEMGNGRKRGRLGLWKLIAVASQEQDVGRFGILLGRLGILGRLFAGYIFERAIFI